MGLLDEDFYNDPQRVALMRLGTGLLAGGDANGRALANGLGGMMEGGIADRKAKQRALEEEQQRQMRALQMQEMQGGLDDRSRTRQEAQADQEFLRGYQPGGQQMPQPQGQAPQGATAGFAPPQQPPGLETYEGKIAMAQDAYKKGRTALAQTLFAQAEKAKPEFDTTPRVGQGADGKPFTYVMDKSGNRKMLDGVMPREPKKVMDLGGSQMAYNEFEIQPGQNFTKTMTTGDQVSLRNAALNRNQQESHFNRREASENARLVAGTKPMTQLQETKYRTQIAKDYQGGSAILQNMDDVLTSADAVLKSPGLSGATGLSSYLYSMPNGKAAQAEVALQNLEGKVTQLGKAAAAQGGAVGHMAVQEWKIVRDMIAAVDPKKGDKPLKEQIELVKSAAEGAAARVRDAYEKHYSADFERYPQFQNLAEPKRSQKGGASGDWDNGAPAKPVKPAAPVTRPPMKGQVKDGYKFKGGNPADPNNWEKQ